MSRISSDGFNRRYCVKRLVETSPGNVVPSARLYVSSPMQQPICSRSPSGFASSGLCGANISSRDRPIISCSVRPNIRQAAGLAERIAPLSGGIRENNRVKALFEESAVALLAFSQCCLHPLTFRKVGNKTGVFESQPHRRGPNYINLLCSEEHHHPKRRAIPPIARWNSSPSSTKRMMIGPRAGTL